MNSLLISHVARNNAGQSKSFASLVLTIIGLFPDYAADGFQKPAAMVSSVETELHCSITRIRNQFLLTTVLSRKFKW